MLVVMSGGGGGGVVVMIVVRRPLFRPSLKIRSKSDQNYFRNRKKKFENRIRQTISDM